jgi:hypothetical protein
MILNSSEGRFRARGILILELTATTSTTRLNEKAKDKRGKGENSLPIPPGQNVQIAS